MAELNPIGKRIHNISPDPVRLTLEDGTEAVFHISGAEFFQQEFQAEGTHDDEDAAYRFVSSEDNDAILVGRQGPDEDGWSMIGEVVAVEPVDSN
ncbi:transcriptional regulator [Natronorubrum aibiense]|uniref:Transcriptional regulator n=1 Tax=Natronorubrum aibiense TaxID=348826 RepID=A0A5P9NYY8_9EURY|nr:transcriptional regulator [Natronorubrum aibiense]QFU81104.1 transcriptional regulator [Natronorubrum aibiense]